MSDLETVAIERLKTASDMSLRLFKQPLVITYSGGKDSDVLLHLAEISGIPFEVLHSLTTADAPETVRHVYDTLKRLEGKGIKCAVDKHVQSDGNRVTMWNLIPRKLMPPDVMHMRMDMAILTALFDGIDVDRMREIVAAERGGRVVVLPCKVGDTVWIIKQTFESSHFEPRGFLLQDAFNIDKTVFLTCAEAKKALEGRKLQGIKVYLSGKITGEGGQPWTD